MPVLARAAPLFELGLDICVFLFLPVLALASRGAAPLAATAGVLALGLAAPAGERAWQQVRGALPLFAALVAWGALSALWAVEPQRSLVVAAQLAGMFAAGLALIAASREIAAPARLVGAFAAGLLVALAVAVAQDATHGELTAPLARRGFVTPALNQVENGLAFALLPLAATLARRGHRLFAAALTVAGAAVIALLVGDAGRVGFALGVAAALLFYLWPRPLARVAAALSVAVILAAPVIFPPLAQIAAARHGAQDVKFSLWHRLEIWSFVGGRIGERPLLGWGLDASRAIPGGNGTTPEGWQLLPLHPHNAPLQLWLELGAPGAALFALFAARLWLALGAAPWPRAFAAAAAGSLVAAFTVGLGAYGIWQEWLIASEFLTLFLILVMARVAAQPMPDRRLGSIS